MKTYSILSTIVLMALSLISAFAADADNGKRLAQTRCVGCHIVAHELFPAEQARIVQLLVERVDVSPHGADIRLRTEGLKNLVTELRAIKPEPRRAA